MLFTRDVLKWVEENRSRPDKPLMSHERVWNDGFLVMLFDGPTPKDRRDFHINTSPEFFYQLVGEMHCRVIEDGRFRDLTVKEGEMFMLPANMPHLNSREQPSLGIVVHQARYPGAKDSIVWYCENCCNQRRGDARCAWRPGTNGRAILGAARQRGLSPDTGAQDSVLASVAGSGAGLRIVIVRT
jgi:3-hydroxyanthranilate 3,4-dioxygenase